MTNQTHGRRNGGTRNGSGGGNRRPHRAAAPAPAKARTAGRYALLSVAAGAVLAQLAAHSAHAASATFSPAPTSNNFNDTGDWVGGVVPGSTGTTTDTSTATFNQTVTTGFGITGSPLLVDPGRNLQNVTFDTAAASPYVIGTTGGNALLLTSGGTIQTTATVANVQTVNAPLVIEPASSTTAGTYTFSSNASSAANVLRIGGPITLGTTSAFDTLNLAGTNTGANILTGTLSDAGTAGLVLNKAGAGTWTFGGNGTSTLAKGNVTVNAGTLAFGGATDAPTLNINGTTGSGVGVFVIAGNFNMNAGTLSVANSQGLVLNGTNTYTQTGGTFTTNGLVEFANGGSSAVSTVNISGGSLTTTIASNDAVDLAVRGTTTVNLSGTGVFNTPVLNMTTSQIPSGGASSTFNLGNGTVGGGTLIVGKIIPGTGGSTGTNTFNFNGGTLQPSISTTTLMAGVMTANVLSGGAVVNTNGFNDTIAQNLLAATGSTGGFTKSSPTPLPLSATTSLNSGLTNTVTDGTLTLSGTSTYAGATTVSAGTLQLSGALQGTSGVVVTGNAAFTDGDATAANNNGVADRVVNTAGLTLGGTAGGGTFAEAFGTSGTTSQTFANLTVSAGGDVITTANTAAGTLNLVFTGTGGNGYVRNTGGALNVISAAGFAPSFTTAPTGSISGTGGNAILVGATLNNNSFVSAAAGPLTAAALTASGSTGLTAGANIAVTGGNTTLAAGTTLSVNSLTFPDITQRTLALGTGSTLTVASGGILAPASVTTDNVNHTISGGSITSGVGDLIINASAGNAGGSRSGTSNFNPRAVSYALTVASNIVDGTSPTALTVTGGSTVNGGAQVLLSGTNTYSGGTYLDGGFIAINADSGLGAATGTVTAASGVNSIATYQNFNFSSSRNFVVDSGALLSFGDPGFKINAIQGTLSGGGIFEVGFVSGNQRIILTGTNTSFTGQYLVNGFLQAVDGVGLSPNANLILAGRGGNGLGVLETSGTFSRSLGTGAGQVQFSSPNVGYSDGGFAAVGGALTVNLGGAGTPSTVTQNTSLFLPGPSILNLQDGSSTAALTFSNPISNNNSLLTIAQNSPNNSVTTAANLTGAISGNGGFTKTGAGLLILSASNTYAGATNVSAGAVAVNGTVASTAAFNVASGATLTGTGSVGGNVTDTGTVDPGAISSTATGTLTVSALTIGSGAAKLTFDLNGSAGDKLAVTGTVTFNGNQPTVTIGQAVTPTAASYVLLTTTTALTLGQFNLPPATVPAGYAYAIGSGGNDLELDSTTATPEPASFASLLLGAGTLLVVRRRKPRVGRTA